jgi:hypothetical protein
MFYCNRGKLFTRERLSRENQIFRIAPRLRIEIGGGRRQNHLESQAAWR